ncbi:TAXI family TRAP transporter solute-binding subunit [[Clostridium] symbiosum]|uniref:TAXI family TRAP transporter solute-binding subunit n=1 Tax=Clostridium symbiosum TaxID=1512 RepID=UPI001D06396D|nr:TAXI family TRAP transporter solute-binding subunit [[Clostridium] symbiosum]MCB6611516.1 TAXI family TRAP transporter solute-binding subunit [[Clostridium] symbiosum]MCB6932913.1 TAXI family TRAP transporter solute-binding subunit [[Clostridium] symbiosum]
MGYRRQYMKWFFAAVAIMAAAGLTGCAWLNAPAEGVGGVEEAGSDFQAGADIDYLKQANVSIASGASGGNYYMVGTALAQTIQKYDPALICSSETTGGTGENIALISSGATTIGMGMADDIASAYEGKRDYEGSPADNLRAICAGAKNTFHVIVMADSDIYSLSDLKGKKISLGPAGAPYFSPSLLESVAGLVIGQDYQGQYLGHDQAADALSDGDVDALIACLSFPASAYSNLAFTKEVRFIGLSQEEMETALEKNQTWLYNTIPAGTYQGQDEDILSPAVPVWLFTHEGVGEDIIYRVCKVIFENVDELGQIAIDAGYYNVDTALDSIVIPIHPGAARYFEEAKRNK